MKTIQLSFRFREVLRSFHARSNSIMLLLASEIRMTGLAALLLLAAPFSLPGAATFTRLYSFPKGAVKPQTSLVLGTDGNFYGTTPQGGTSDSGAVFRVSPTGEEATLYSFSGGTDGLTPGTALIQGSDGNFYGTTKFGGQLGGPNDPQGTGLGTIFRITPAGVLTTLHKFVGGNADGSRPQGDLLQGFDGNFYGTTAAGGPDDLGTVFRMTPHGALTILYSFTLAQFSNGYNPTAALVKGADGNYYGTTTSGGANFRGAVFKMTPAGVVSLFYSFDDTNPDGGTFPDGPLVLGRDGNFYGTTPKGGNNNYGTAYQLTSSGVYTTLHSFSAGLNPDGGGPEGALIEGAPGDFYGTASFGGANGGGVVFKITSAGGFTPLYSFSAQESGDGQIPLGALIAAGDGNFYGTTSQGALGGNVAVFRGNGTVFKISPAGVLTTVHQFAPAPYGGTPHAGLIQVADGNFYGTSFGGASDVGAIFKITPAGNYTTLYSFTGDADGNGPEAALAEGSGGNFMAQRIKEAPTTTARFSRLHPRARSRSSTPLRSIRTAPGRKRHWRGGAMVLSMAWPAAAGRTAITMAPHLRSPRTEHSSRFTPSFQPKVVSPSLRSSRARMEIFTAHRNSAEPIPSATFLKCPPLAP